MAETAVQTLADFLLARIEEDEAVAARWPADIHVPSIWAQDDRGHPIYAARAKLLAECEAKRRIIDWHHKIPLPYERQSLLKLVALPYTDHPDFRDEWRA